MMNAVINISKFLLFLATLQIGFYCLAFFFNKDEAGRLDKNTILKLTEDSFHDTDDLKEAVSEYYISILNKDWNTVYKFRSDDIKRLADEETFLAIMDKKMSLFSLEDLVFQKIEIRGIAERGKYNCRLVVRVTQNPHGREHTAVVNWSKESGTWKCDSFGLKGDPILWLSN